MRHCLFILLFSPAAFSQQTVNDYPNLITQADSLYEGGSFKEAAYMYTEAFEVNGWKGFIPDLYNSARSWARIGNLDSAFRKLERVITYARHNDFQKFKDFPRDPAFRSLHGDDRWQDLILKAEKKYNNPLIQELDTIFKTDQEYRLIIWGLNSQGVSQELRVLSNICLAILNVLNNQLSLCFTTLLLTRNTPRRLWS